MNTYKIHKGGSKYFKDFESLQTAQSWADATLGAGYTVTLVQSNIDSITALSQGASMDYHQTHLAISSKCAEIGFNNLTLVEKDVVCKWCAADDNTIVTHFATVYTAGNLLAAMQMHADNIGVYVSELQKVASARLDDPRTITAIMMHLKDRAQIDLFIAAIRNYAADYKKKFHVGTMYGDTTDGIMDFIENTGSHFADGDGLDGFQFSQILEGGWLQANAADPQNPTAAEQDAAHDYVRDLLALKLKNILVYGDFN